MLYSYILLLGLLVTWLIMVCTFTIRQVPCLHRRFQRFCLRFAVVDASTYERPIDVRDHTVVHYHRMRLPASCCHKTAIPTATKEDIGKVIASYATSMSERQIRYVIQQQGRS
jgi:hypothetical protein